MSVLNVEKYGAQVLRDPAKEVHKVSKKIQKLVDDMFDTMYASNGVGLAAPQIGVDKRVFVIDVSAEGNPSPQLVFINPVIIKKEGAIISHEGCLSFPDVWVDVKRYETITVRAKDIKGKTFTLTPEPGSLLCRCIQHENDHLNGILFIDHIIDRFGADTILEAAHLPPIDPERILEEEYLDNLLKDVVKESSEVKAS